MEIHVNYWKLVGAAPSDFENVVNSKAGVEILMDQRHLVLRGTTASKIIKLGSKVLEQIRAHYFSQDYVEVQPPTIVQTQCEGGSTLFKMDYFGEMAYMTQSSQLYLETVIPSFRDVFCITQSYRAEKSRTRRHLTEFVQVEAECAFITFEDLLTRLEDLICEIISGCLKSEHRELFLEMNPNLAVPKRPFMRMEYRDAIKYCNENGIRKNEEGELFVDGDDITEKPEREMTDRIGQPIFMIKFPSEMKSFYMAKVPEDRTLTESVDLLMPGVGEIIGGSMRISDYDELIEAYKKNGLNPDPYYWYTDVRKYGTTPHGGYGMGLGRLLCYMLNVQHIRDVVLYPRLVGRAYP